MVQIKFLAMHIFWYIYCKKYSKHFHGKWSLLNILMNFGITNKQIKSTILTYKLFATHLRWMPNLHDVECSFQRIMVI